jgi:POT family proton-dependent oligopeptide transporter
MSDNTANPPSASSDTYGPTFLGQPTGLFMLFFAEMWERFSYYGMRALLVFYMIKGFLRYEDGEAYAVYGAYTALVYLTPFFGGMIADRLLGQRRAVVLGGLLMAAGHLLMTVETPFGFYTALALLISGNGFFKPNISTIVGTLYPEGSSKRDAGFTIFYMGINLGAAMSPLLCGYIGETYGWHYGFGLATIGMLIGLATFVMPTLVTQGLILVGAAAAAISMIVYHPDNPISTAFNIFVALSLLISGGVALVALSRGGLSRDAGAPPDPEKARTGQWFVYGGTLLAIPIFALLVSGFAPFTQDKRGITVIPDSVIEKLTAPADPAVPGTESKPSAVKEILAVVLTEISRPAGLVLFVCGLGAAVYLGFATARLELVPRQRMYVVLILTFFSMLFWSFFEQAGSSLNNFTDRNVDRVSEDRTITGTDVGQTIRIQPTQEQLGFHNGSALFTLTDLDKLRESEANPDFEIDWTVAPDNVGMGIAERIDEIPASTFQAVNPVYILIFGLVFTALWTKLGERGLEPSTPVKFALGLLQLGLGFGAFWYGAMHAANDRGMVALPWLLLGYLLQTTGELCLSPVGLAMVTRLSPKHLVSTVMGTWFLATAFSQFLAAIIAQFTGVEHSGDGPAVIPVPKETVAVYGEVFGHISIAAMISALICFLLVPLLKRWMHTEEMSDNGKVASGRH